MDPRPAAAELFPRLHPREARHARELGSSQQRVKMDPTVTVRLSRAAPTNTLPALVPPHAEELAVELRRPDSEELIRALFVRRTWPPLAGLRELRPERQGREPVPRPSPKEVGPESRDLVSIQRARTCQPITKPSAIEAQIVQAKAKPIPKRSGASVESIGVPPVFGRQLYRSEAGTTVSLSTVAPFTLRDDAFGFPHHHFPLPTSRAFLTSPHRA